MFFFNIPASAIRDLAVSADGVLGPVMLELGERLAEASDDRLALVAKRFLARFLGPLQKNPRTRLTLRMTKRMRAQPGELSIERFAALHGLSIRQTERIFQEFVKVTPKMFKRLERLNFAIRTAGASSLPDWTAIALASGYFDKSHLIRDFQKLNGTTPKLFVALSDEVRKLRQMSSDTISSNVAFIKSDVGRILLR